MKILCSVVLTIMQRLIPEVIINRKKQGFSSPDESWYRGENLSYVRELLLSPRAVITELINPAYIESVIRKHCEEGVNLRLLIWSLLSFEMWLRLFLMGEEPPEGVG